MLTDYTHSQKSESSLGSPYLLRTPKTHKKNTHIIFGPQSSVSHKEIFRKLGLC